MKAWFTLFLAFFTMTGFAQGWVLQSPYPTYQHLYAVDFPSATIGYVSGDNGTLLKTMDAGATWEQVHVPAYFYNSQIRNINFTDNQTGFIAQGKQVYKTVDGGESWSASALLSLGTLQGTHFINQNTGFAFGCYESLAKTTDGGTTWTVISYAPLSVLHYSYMDFASASAGYLVAQDWYYEEAVLRKTSDGGITWTNVTVPEEINYVSGLEVLSANELWIGAGNTFWNPQTGYAARAYHSTDGGITWTTHSLGIAGSNTGGVLDIKFFSPTEGRIVNLNHLYATHDGGATWSDSNTGANACVSCFTPAAWVNESTSYIAGYSPALIYSDNNGQTPEDLVSGGTPQLWTTYFKDSLHGYVGGSYNGNAILRYTNNGGTLWQDAALGSLPGRTVYDVAFANSSNGWAFYDDGCAKTTNGGQTWSIHTASFNLLYSKASVSDPNSILVAGYNSGYGGKIYRSADQGITWTLIFDGVPNYDKTVGFIFTDMLTGYLALKPMTSGMPGKLLKTTNGGISWSEVSTGDQSEIVSISFINNLTGIISLSGKRILRTADGGNTWSEAAYGASLSPSNTFPAAVTYVRMFNANDGVAAIRGQYLFTTNDGGRNFEEIYHGSTIWPYASGNAYFTDQEHGWASAFQGMIMKYSATLTSVNDPSSQGNSNPGSGNQDNQGNAGNVNEECFFYPNPAGETIRITETGYRTVVIYSFSGKEVMKVSILNSSTLPEINIGSLEQGLYIIVLTGDEGIRAARMVKVN